MSEQSHDTSRGENVQSLVHTRDWFDILSTLLLALATVATAWSGYQASRWSGEQAIAFADAGAARVQSNQLSTVAGQQVLVDVAVFLQWFDAFTRGEDKLATSYETRFRDGFKPAFEAWLATKPRTNPDAPKSPFEMQQYHVPGVVESSRLSAQADAAGARARVNNQRSDNYVLCVVLFATTLFFAGISPKLASRGSRWSILALGYLVYFATVGWIATFPVSFSV